MTERQLIAWLNPCPTEAQEVNPLLGSWIERDGVRWFTNLAVTLKPRVMPVACWHLTLSGFNRKLKPVPVTGPNGEILWNEVRTKCAASIADDELAGVGARRLDGTPEVTAFPELLFWHFFLPLSGAESINLTKRRK
jgi:hypothetical protein